MSQFVADRMDLSGRTHATAQAALAGRVGGLRAGAALAGPAVIASVAYMDPGNFATNIQAGASYGMMLLWVVLAANLIAILFQGLSAKLGIVTGRSLAELCRDHLPRPVTVAMWLASEAAAMATDLAEFLGGAIGLSLLLHIPLLAGLACTAVLTYALLLAGGSGFRRLELAIGALVILIGLCYLAEILIAPPNWRAVAAGTLVPRLAGPHSITLAVGIIGATVMPHAIYLHSALTRDRVRAADAKQMARLIRFSWREVVVALGLAGLVNMAMLAMAGTVFHNTHPHIAQIETAYRTLTPLLGAGAAGVFMISLLAAGLSSSVVGTIAGQQIMVDFVDLRLPIAVRRLITMVPSFAVVAWGVDPTQALVLSQVVLSLVLPLPLAALLWFVSRRSVMGTFASGPVVRIVAAAACVLVLVLNAVLLVQALA
jgi:manganese transport protein